MNNTPVQELAPYFYSLCEILAFYIFSPTCGGFEALNLCALGHEIENEENQ